MNFTLEATGGFTFGYDIQSYVKILLCIQSIKCFPLETDSRSVCQDQGKTGNADWQSLSFKLQNSKKEYNFTRSISYEERKRVNLWGKVTSTYNARNILFGDRETIIFPKLAVKMTTEICTIVLNNIAQLTRLPFLKNNKKKNKTKKP